MADDARHETIVVTRDLELPPPTIFAGFADDAVRRRWFRLPGSDASYEAEFRVAGGESARSTFRHLDGRTEELEYRSRYIDLTTDRRIVYAYESIVDGLVRWASLVTVELAENAGGGTRLNWTEQVAFLKASGDGSADLPHLRGAIALRLNGLAAALASAA
ncbi:SRPBCC domain-containing protein [Agromyces sp. Soil535]|uniref:SRPBCC domain-containing protein n=1 Tax=Agromyces sp. Soil535 TaxID=1736390 RepID=UPI0006F37478|nr:SRPBCC domain-containing protein [Agromyces sp. Soil535]KRE22479.1 hypothetical protein ASG80_11280 [Agromyces sp. Soil535]